MMSVRLQSFLIVALFSETMAQLSFTTPPQGGASVSFPENQAVGTALYTIQANDPAGNTPHFTVLSSTCESTTPSPTQVPPFPINTADQLVVPTGGLDAENCSHYTFTIRVSAGTSTLDSGPLKILVTDINDNPPTFDKSSYNGNVSKTSGQGQIVNTDPIIATDPDVSKLPVTLSIAGAQTTFAINTNGYVYVNDMSGLAVLASPTVLTIQASDGSLTSTALLTIILNDDPCASTPCKNGGNCTSTNGNYKCSCLFGYTGSNCENVNYCSINPCQNGGNCTSTPSGYTCNCSATITSESTDVNCTVNYCSKNPCQNGGTCTSSSSGYTCNCSATSEFTGVNCTDFTPYQNGSTSTTTVPPPMPCTREWPFWTIVIIDAVYIIFAFILYKVLDIQGTCHFITIAAIVFVLMTVGIAMWICFG